MISLANSLKVGLLLLYVLLSAFLETTLGGRATPAEIVLVGIMAICAFQVLARSTVKFSPIYFSAIPLLFVFGIGVVFANDREAASIELLITVFGFLGSIAMFNVLVNSTDRWLDYFLVGYVFVIGALTF